MRCTTATCASSASRTVCSPKPCAASPACAAIPARRRARAQIDGTAAGAISPAVTERLQYIPAFGDWTLLQPNANSFTIRKRTADGHAWLDAGQGHRASGLGYVGGPSGGIAFGIRNFWQSHPAQLDIRHAHEDQAEVTMWVWAPDATPMDLRFYHDGLGQDTYEKQLKGGSRSPTKTTSPASARRWASRAPAS